MDKKLQDLRKNTSKAEDFFTHIMAYTLGPMEVKEMLEEENVVLLDVRDKEAYDESHIPQAISIPRSELDDRLVEMAKDNLHIVYCYNQQCHLGACACRLLASKGYPCMLMEGGFQSWSEYFRFATIK